MLYVFDLDGTLIEGFLETKTCAACGGGGRQPTTKTADHILTDTEPWERCEPCKGKGVKFGKKLDYGRVEVMPGRLERLFQLRPPSNDRFAIATNQGGVAMGYQTPDEVAEKMGKALAALRFFYGQPVSMHIAMHHPEATVPGWSDPAACKLRKPLPGMLYAAMEAHGASPNETVFVGDLATDRDCAEAAGVKYEWADEFFASPERQAASDARAGFRV